MPKGHGLAPGTLQNLPLRVRRALGREGGRVSGLVRRNKILDRYLKLLAEGYGERAIRLCRRESYQAGWIKGYKKGRSFSGDTGE